jgi:GTP-binding protein Era
MSDEQVKAGFVALIGKPNVGKSTLLNAYLGQKVSIVSPKPQTTRVPVRGILNGPDAQVVFVDTPGIHQPRHKLGTFMVDVARKSIPNADVLCFVVDISAPPTRQDREIAELVRTSRQPHILVLNKVDATREAEFHLQQYRELGPWQQELAVSARDRLGLETLLEAIVANLPSGPRLYPEDQLSDMSERELVAEMIREKVMLNTDQEIPHSIAVEVEEWEDREKAIYIRANISVEKDSQKGIIIGAGGSMLKKIGAAARYEIERSLDQHVFLDLWVKVRENWRQKPNELRWLGYDVKFFKG